MAKCELYTKLSKGKFSNSVHHDCMSHWSWSQSRKSLTLSKKLHAFNFYAKLPSLRCDMWPHLVDEETAALKTSNFQKETEMV